MVTITFPNDTRDTINSIRDAIGRYVTFVSHTVSGCYNCTLDPFTDTSINSFCPVCSGTYYISIYSGASINSHITWGQADILNWYTAGQQFDGDVRIQIELTVANLDAVNHCDWIQVDDHCVEIKKKILRGVQPLNRILLDCIELEKEPIDFIILNPIHITPPIPLLPIDFEVGLVDAYTIVVTFNMGITGWLDVGVGIGVNGFAQVVDSAIAQANPAIVYYILGGGFGGVVSGDVVTWEYIELAGNTTSLDGTIILHDIPPTSVTNNVP